MDDNVGQYDIEYKSCPCFWGTEPGKYVKKALAYISNGTAIDLGAGEGKNSIFLAQKGFIVDAIEVSNYAIQNFNDQLALSDDSIKSAVTIYNTDVRTLKSEKRYDLTVAYGLLHCMQTMDEVRDVVAKIKILTAEQGFCIIVSFNNRIPLPDVQSYLEPTLLPEGYLKEEFQNWDILDYEDDIITESHPTSKIEHQHSVTRMIARKR